METIIKNGKIIDPVDGEYEANIRITGGIIDEITTRDITGDNVIDAESCMVSPGFIDIHAHEEPIINGKVGHEIMDGMVRMGVTTAVGGNCGVGEPDVLGYTDLKNRTGSPCNYTGLIGISSLRQQVGCENIRRPACREQIEKMKEVLSYQLEKGVIGISFGLEYCPGVSTDEMMQICAHVSGFEDKLVACHYRYDADRSLEALGEMIIAARENDIKFQVSHINSLAGFGSMTPALEMMRNAHRAGVDIMADSYPYNAFCTHLDTTAFDDGCLERWGVGYDALQIAEGEYNGVRCTEELFRKLRAEKAHLLTIAYVMNEEEVVQSINDPLVMIGSDVLLSNGQGHPRSCGTFPRVISKYVREEQQLTLQSAIDKMTRMPAERLGLQAKGRIKEGYDADITIFNFDEIKDRATFEDPVLPPLGIKYVLVNGKAALKDGMLTGANSGKALLSI